MWLPQPDNENTWYPLDVKRVNEILEMNKKGKKPVTLAEDIVEEVVDDGGLNSDLVAMDKKFSKGKSRSKNKNKRNKKRNFSNKNNNRNKGNRPNNKKNNN